ncbi:flagellar basal body P-ring formation chaperone FlgA [Photobacterium sp.]|uniref:flagellar basal body P-ring formation chaperone FlgA n=1 Tax=Photobacterium sp. TaxID=660 RepID=UPI00299DE551|nr:flagellar basal body P-ring formation chaperone FlgA [Photobacterium sp.]MDX1301101.1 flagellar basal body P-ring formation chaperone FlgA [Photobacterium sp.]
MDTKKLTQFLKEQITLEIQLYAERHRWQDLSTNLDITIPLTAKYLPLCQVPLIITASDQQSMPVGNLKRQVECNSQDQTWVLNATIRAAIRLPVVVATTTINRKTKITASMLRMQELHLTKAKTFTTQFSDVIGKRVKRRIRSGQLINPAQLQQLWLVEKGDEVVIIASKNGMQASMKGIAQDNGVKGEQIDVRNSSSSKIIRTIVASRGKVETIF